MKIIFNKEEHSYKGIKNGEEVDLLNVSTFKKKYQREFDVFAVSGRLAEKQGNQMDIIKGWKMKGKISKTYGSALHLTLEGYIKHHIIPKDKYLIHFLKSFQKLIDELEIKKEDLISEEIDGNEELEIGGTIDMNSSTTLFDLKTGDFRKKKKGNLKKPFNFLPDSPGGSATLQLNFYRLFGENYDKELSVFSWDGMEFEIVHIAKFSEEQMEILREEIKKYDRRT